MRGELGKSFLSNSQGMWLMISILLETLTDKTGDKERTYLLEKSKRGIITCGLLKCLPRTKMQVSLSLYIYI